MAGNSITYTIPPCGSCARPDCSSTGVQEDITGNAVTAPSAACGAPPPPPRCCPDTALSDIGPNAVGYTLPLCPPLPPVVTCSDLDTGYSWPDFASLANPQSYTETPVYGSHGFVDSADSSDCSGAWFQCDYVDFCDGPEEEGVGLETVYDRFAVRWGARLEAGAITYGKVGESFAPVDPLLYPSIPADARGITISFDANSRACFATERTGLGRVELRRFVAGLPVTHDWPGSSPKLFYNGLLQFDQAQRDLVCYYINGGNLCARFQRDLFATEYVILPLGDALQALRKTDRGSADAASFQFLAAEAASGVCRLFRSEPYSPWPQVVEEAGSLAAALTDGDYFALVIPVGPYIDAANTSAGVLSGAYDSITITTVHTETGLFTPSIPGGDYLAIIVLAPTAADTGSLTSSLSGGDYAVVIILGGSYAESATCTPSLTGGSYT